MFTPDSPLIISSSSLAAWLRCPKSYEISYVKHLDVPTTSEAVEQGRNFHQFMENAANGKQIKSSDPMAEVARQYLKYNPLPEDIKGAEVKTYVRLLPNVILRCTFDLIYQKQTLLVARDYKTFDRAPSLDVDLDFQGRLYIAQLAHMPGSKEFQTVFEYENVRRCPPGTKNSKGVWSPAECYIRETMVISQGEIETVWADAQEAANALLTMYERNRWYRSPLKVGPHSCGSCFVKNLCLAELQNGVLDDQTISLLSVPRKPLEMPEGV